MTGVVSLKPRSNSPPPALREIKPRIMETIITTKGFSKSFFIFSLYQKDQKLHTSQPIEHEKIRKEKLGEKTSEKPAEKIVDWLKVIEKTHMGHRENPEVLKRTKASYRKEYVITPENVPESTFLLEQRITRERGHGTIEITDEFKNRKINEIIGNQEKSIDKWVNYLSSPDAIYPIWAKY